MTKFGKDQMKTTPIREPPMLNPSNALSDPVT